MRIINKKYLLIILLIGVILPGVIILKPKENMQLDNVVLKQEVNNKTFAMYKEDGESYVPVEGTKFPEGYVLNITESKCIDNNGNELNNVLSYENDEVTITSGNTTYCYLYFNLNPLVKKLLQDKNEDTDINYVGDLWRYQGTDNVNNWICFGTEENCSTTEDNIDKYMYRIIGITSDGSLKLIKEIVVKSIGELYDQFSWNNNETISDCGVNGEYCTWPNSILFKRLNGISNGSNYYSIGDSNLFIGNNRYSYLEDNNIWIDKIQEHEWKYGEINNTEIINSNNLDLIYRTEKNFDQFVTAKIGLMYMHDYMYAYKTYDIVNNDVWINMQKDLFNLRNNWEWIISRYTNDNSKIFAWTLRSSQESLYEFGYSLFSLINYDGVRPVFYTINNLQIKEDTKGSKENPYIIE